MFGRLADDSKRAMARARVEAVRLRHARIGTEHVFLALLADAECGAGRALRSLGADPVRLRREVELNVPAGPKPVPDRQLPFSPEMKLALEGAVTEAEALGRPPIGTEHLLLGIVRDRTGVVSLSLGALNVDVDVLAERLRAGDAAPSR